MRELTANEGAGMAGEPIPVRDRRHQVVQAASPEQPERQTRACLTLLRAALSVLEQAEQRTFGSYQVPAATLAELHAATTAFPEETRDEALAIGQTQEGVITA